MRRGIVLAGLLLVCGSVSAQQSASHRLEEHTFNAGGHPVDGAVLVSTSFRMTLGAVGDGVSLVDPSSHSFVMTSGFLGAYPAPGEIANLRFRTPDTLVWDGERSTGVYNVYLGSVTRPFDPLYGECHAPGIPLPATSVAAAPKPGEALFILVTAENRLGEEGTKGASSAGITRDDSNACP